MRTLKFTAHIDHFEGVGFVGSIIEIPGLVEQATTLDGVKKELMLSLRVKLAYDNNVELSSVQALDESECNHQNHFTAGPADNVFELHV